MAQKIINLIAREIGPMEGLVIDAALRIAAERWNQDDTVEYGTRAKELLDAWHAEGY